MSQSTLKDEHSPTEKAEAEVNGESSPVLGVELKELAEQAEEKVPEVEDDQRASKDAEKSNAPIEYSPLQFFLLFLG
ncbi:hypothetical protein HDU93_009463, partial [Gonapodya sp. JEL0774]